MSVTAYEMKKIADEAKAKLVNNDISNIMDSILEKAESGEHSLSVDKLSNDVRIKLRELGYTIESGGRMNEIEYIIRWDDIVETPSTVSIVKSELFYKDGIIGKGLMSKEMYIKYIEDIMMRFDNVCWGGPQSKYSGATNYIDVVVVYEKGIRGPADWFYLNKDHKWAHGGYTGYKHTYTNTEFLEMIAKIHEQNGKH